MAASEEEKSQTTVLRRAIRGLLTKTPVAYPQWGHQRTVGFKDAVKKARTVSNSTKSTLEAMRQAYRALLAYHDEVAANENADGPRAG